jgi:hypothetical protein
VHSSGEAALVHQEGESLLNALGNGAGIGQGRGKQVGSTVPSQLLYVYSRKFLILKPDLFFNDGPGKQAKNMHVLVRVHDKAARGGDQSRTGQLRHIV